MFSRLYVSMVRAGELGGILDEVLNRLATQLEKEDSIRRAVKSAMVYPILIGCFAIIVLIGMVLFLIPIFADMYKDLGNAKLPTLTRIMIGISDVMRRARWYIIFLVAIIAAHLRPASGSSRPTAATHVWDRFKLQLPMGIGEIVRKLAVARFSRTLGTLITSGVPILQAIEITGQAAGNVVIEDAMVDVQQSVKEGQSITGPLEKVSVFPPMVTQMISRGRGDRLARRDAAARSPTSTRTRSTPRSSRSPRSSSRSSCCSSAPSSARSSSRCTCRSST